jgi:Zn-dependent peptidase ImmA (M78 family)
MDPHAIEGMTYELLSEHGMQRTIPVPLTALAEALGVTVVRTVFTDLTISGLIILQNGRATIHVNPQEPLVRQRFTAAHELGHYWLHLRAQHAEGGFVDTKMTIEAVDDPVDDLAEPAIAFRRQNSTGPHERDANRFAAALLMPAPLVRATYNAPADLPRLAEWFGVSLGSLAIRLRELHL